MSIRKHSWYYLLLISVLSVGLFFMVGTGDKSAQLTSFIAVTLLYIVIGVIHHKTEHDLHTKVVIEYILMGLLGIAIMFFLLQ